jgi:hypothetical protein
MLLLLDGIFSQTIQQHYYLSWHNPTERSQSQTNKLPLWPFWDKNHLTGFKIESRSKTKKYSPFLSQKDKGKIEYKKNQQ